MLHDEYHKARSHLALVSGLLLAWEYVGVSFSAPGTPAHAKVPLADMEVTIRNPEVLPIIISILVLYFSGRLLLEWRQAPEALRSAVPAVTDVGVSFALGLVALGVFAVQRLSTFRLAVAVSPSSAALAIAGISAAVVSTFVAVLSVDEPEKHPWMVWSRAYIGGISVAGLWLLLRHSWTEAFGLARVALAATCAIWVIRWASNIPRRIRRAATRVSGN